MGQVVKNANKAVRQHGMRATVLSQVADSKKVSRRDWPPETRRPKKCWTCPQNEPEVKRANVESQMQDKSNDIVNEMQMDGKRSSFDDARTRGSFDSRTEESGDSDKKDVGITGEWREER